MFNLISLGIGLVSLFFALFALLPFLGWANWLILPLPVIGAVVGLISRRRSGLVLNLIVIVVAVLRLRAGGGWF